MVVASFPAVSALDLPTSRAHSAPRTRSLRLRAAELFHRDRIPYWLEHFEKVLMRYTETAEGERVHLVKKQTTAETRCCSTSSTACSSHS